MERLRCEFQQGYGLTESSPNLTTLRPEDHVLNGPPEIVARLSSVGRESVGVQVRVVDDHGVDVPAGERGEIVARGTNIMEGYWRQPEATTAAIRDGWLHTGDIGVLDDRNFLFLVDRTTDMLISGGINVYPREIELQLEQHAAVAEAAVVSRADPRWGEVPVAFVALRPGASREAVRQELERMCRQRLAGYKQPKDYLFLDALPRNTMGKVLKRELRARLGARGM
jgi:acyl-CoA synthetase (AMP-forming)/AMP-acid ligase II